MSAVRPNWTPHYAELRKRLEALRYIFPSGARGETYSCLYDDFIENREFGLAVDVLCDFLLESESPPPSENEFHAIAELHALMELGNSTLLRLRDKRQSSDSANRTR